MGTMVFSRDDALIGNYMVAMENILDLMDGKTRTFCAPLKSALKEGKKVLEKYYNRLDESDVYRIAMSASFTVWHLSSYSFLAALHPGLKLERFSQRNYSKEWISDTKKIVTSVFKDYQKKLKDHSIEIDSDPHSAPGTAARVGDNHSEFSSDCFMV